LTFDKAAIDVSQVLCQDKHTSHYRVCSLEGLILLSTNERNFKRSDVMDYALNKASEELLKNSLHFETKILFIITSLTVSIGMI
jgi:hypothetical protein